MGIFTRKTKPKRKTRASKTDQRGWLKAKPAKRSQPTDRTAMWQKLRLAGTVATVIALGVGGYFAHHALIEQVGKQTARPPVVMFEGVPDWMGADRIALLERIVAANVSDNPLDHASLGDVYEALSRHPWVESVHRIARPDADRVAVRLTIRTPVAVVGAANGFHLVDAAGHRLPGVYRYEQLRSLNLLAITGVREAPPVEGKAWPGDDVQAGLALVKRIAANRWAEQVEQVNVANYDGRLNPRLAQLVMITHDNGKLNWGRPVGQEQGLEPSTAQKLANIDNIVFRYGRIDANAAEVDLYTRTPFIHTQPAVRYTSAGE